MVLLEPGDKVRLTLVRAERVLPGDIYWGTQMWPDSPSRKGFLLESEGIPVPRGAEPGGGDKVRIGPHWILADDFVLIQDKN